MIKFHIYLVIDIYSISERISATDVDLLILALLVFFDILIIIDSINWYNIVYDNLIIKKYIIKIIEASNICGCFLIFL